MKNFLNFTVVLCILGITNAETLIQKTVPPTKSLIVFCSAINGRELKAEIKGTHLHEAGGTVKVVQRTVTGENAIHDVGSFVEPKGGVTLAEALRLAEVEAHRILGDKLMGKGATWHLDSASRKAEGKDSCYSYYYHFSFIPRDGTTDANKDLLTQQLQIIVLLDGRLLPTLLRDDK